VPGRPGRSPATRSGHGRVQHAGRPAAKSGSAAAFRTSAVIAVAVCAAVIFGSLRPNGGAATADGATKPASVRVTASQLIGRPVDVVRLRLQRAGLAVRVRWQQSDSVGAGDVMAVRPVGLVPVHSVVVIIGSSGRSAVGPAADGGSGTDTGAQSLAVDESSAIPQPDEQPVTG
jgi:hypothetical protein